MAVIDLFTGLLGAGKTTLIRHYCEHLAAQGKRFAIIENEFGFAGVIRRHLFFGSIPRLPYRISLSCSPAARRHL